MVDDATCWLADFWRLVGMVLVDGSGGDHLVDCCAGGVVPRRMAGAVAGAGAGCWICLIKFAVRLLLVVKKCQLVMWISNTLGVVLAGEFLRDLFFFNDLPVSNGDFP